MKKAIGSIFGALLAICFLAACSNGQTADLAAKGAAGTQANSNRTAVQMADLAVPVQKISRAEADSLAGISTGMGAGQQARFHQSYKDAENNVYRFDAHGRLTAYVANEDAPDGRRIRLAGGEGTALDSSLRETIDGLVPYASGFTLWDDPNAADPLLKTFSRTVSGNQADSISVKMDENGLIRDLFVSYCSDGNAPIPDAKKAELDRQAQAALEKAKSEQNADSAEISWKAYAQSGQTITAQYTFLFTFGGAQSAENYACTANA